jgi:hypothetical protein
MYTYVVTWGGASMIATIIIRCGGLLLLWASTTCRTSNAAGQQKPLSVVSYSILDLFRRTEGGKKKERSKGGKVRSENKYEFRGTNELNKHQHQTTKV